MEVNGIHWVELGWFRSSEQCDTPRVVGFAAAGASQHVPKVDASLWDARSSGGTKADDKNDKTWTFPRISSTDIHRHRSTSIDIINLRDCHNHRILFDVIMLWDAISCVARLGQHVRWPQRVQSLDWFQVLCCVFWFEISEYAFDGNSFWCLCWCFVLSTFRMNMAAFEHCR